MADAQGSEVIQGDSSQFEKFTAFTKRLLKVQKRELGEVEYEKRRKEPNEKGSAESRKDDNT